MRKNYFSEFARLGGKSKSRSKQAAARRNGRLGGRPKKNRKETIRSWAMRDPNLTIK
jgi:hypothetical protein